jgi:hypothetical protein
MKPTVKKSRFVFEVTICVAVSLTGCAGRTAPSATPAPEPAPASEKAAPAADEEAAPATPSAPSRATSGALPQAPPPPAPAGAAPPSSMHGEGARAGTLESAPQDIVLFDQKLDGVLALAAPDCTTAWALRDRICDLAQRLCDLADRSAEPDVAERCTDGRARCAHATERVRAACGE